MDVEAQERQAANAEVRHVQRKLLRQSAWQESHGKSWEDR